MTEGKEVVVVKKPPANAGAVADGGSVPGWEDPLEEEMATQSHGLRSLVGYSSWGGKESDMTEHT